MRHPRATTKRHHKTSVATSDFDADTFVPESAAIRAVRRCLINRCHADTRSPLSQALIEKRGVLLHSSFETLLCALYFATALCPSRYMHNPDQFGYLQFANVTAPICRNVCWLARFVLAQIYQAEAGAGAASHSAPLQRSRMNCARYTIS